jgi:hypothetical protein
MEDYLNIALIQPTFDPGSAWTASKTSLDPDTNRMVNKATYYLNMNKTVAESIWTQIRIGIKNVMRNEIKPNIILIPELHLSQSHFDDLQGIAQRNGVMIIAGLDFIKNEVDNTLIENAAKIIVPNNWPERNYNSGSQVIKFGKTHFTYMEKMRFKQQASPPKECKELQEPNMYILSSKHFGNIGLMICSDFFDIERYLIYQGRIHHLFVISLNKDVNTYFHLAESLTRLLYANIVVCNSGVYGGSVVHSPFYDSFKRTIYKHGGPSLFNYQVVQVPVKTLDAAQKFDFSNKDRKDEGILFKAHPPGYKRTPFDPPESINDNLGIEGIAHL